MSVQDIIVIGAGAGGVQSVESVLSGLPSDLPGSVLIVQHVPGHTPSGILDTLNRSSKLVVTYPENGEKIEFGRAYLAPPNRHLLVKRGAICLGNGPKENRARPAIDALFRTAAHCYGSRVVGVILSGVLNDGSAGLMAIKRHGGISIAAKPDEAVFDGMPRSAIAYTSIDHILTVNAIAPMLVSLVDGGIGKNASVEVMSAEMLRPDSAEVGGCGLSNGTLIEAPCALTCPACGGAVWEMQEDALTMFKCHVGHSYTSELMLEEQSEAVDAAAWVLLRSLEENINLRKRLASWSRLTGRMQEAEYHDQQAMNANKQSIALRTMVLSPEMGGD